MKKVKYYWLSFLVWLMPEDDRYKSAHKEAVSISRYLNEHYTDEDITLIVGHIIRIERDNKDTQIVSVKTELEELQNDMDDYNDRFPSTQI